MRRLLFTISFLLLVAFVALPGHYAFAQAPAETESTTTQLDHGSSELEEVRAALGRADPNENYSELRSRAQAVAVIGTSALDTLTPRLETIQATLDAIGEPADGEAADIQEQRLNLTRERDEVDSSVKRARLLITSARETVDAVNRTLADRFNRNTLERFPSPLGAAYWQAVLQNLPSDIAHLGAFFNDTARHFVQSLSWKGTLIVGSAFAISFVLVFPLRRRLQLIGLNYASTRAPKTRARRSLLALWFVLIGAMTVSVAVLMTVQSLDWSGVLTRPASSLAWALAGALIFCSVIVSLGSALLLVDRGSWRLLPIDDDDVQILKPFPAAAATLLFFGIGLPELNNASQTSPIADATANLFFAVCHIALLASILLGLTRLRRSREKDADQSAKPRSLVTFVILLGWIAVLVCLVALARGYVNLALLIGREVVWSIVVISFTYLLMAAADDTATTLLSTESRAGNAVVRGFGLREETVRQAGIIVSAIARVVIGFLALSAIVAPLGGGTAPIYTQLTGITSISFGGIEIRPGALIRAIVALMLGLLGVKLLRGWMERTFLPATNLDAGARNSALTIVRYFGITIAAFWAISTLGIGMERIALLASALSVGIGFGLQAITQNFISGLILLAERPIKIGDTIQVGADEGDVKRINVRSTEIQISDRSTLIVPNSELITKTVRNMTLANPLGRVQIKFAVAVEDDVGQTIDLLLKLFADHEAVLAEPNPTVMVDSIADGKILLVGTAFVSSPRLVYAIRSELFLGLLKMLKDRGVATETATIAADEEPDSAAS